MYLNNDTGMTGQLTVKHSARLAQLYEGKLASYKH